MKQKEICGILARFDCTEENTRGDDVEEAQKLCGSCWCLLQAKS
ncbi:hypothetical protein V6Z11_A10G177000 [Gossypium hirsutum]